MLHLNTSHSSETAPDVRYAKRETHPDYEVQIFLGSSFHTLYMDVETAREFAQRILAALPVEVSA